MRLATIDLGSNTVRFLVAEVTPPRGWSVVDHAQSVTRLSEGLAASGRLGEAPMARTLAVVAAYVDRATRAHADDVRIVATSAVRDAANGRSFGAALERTTGRRVDVVSGLDEARLTLRGVAHGLGPLPGRTVTFDIGGGSTEFILARDGAFATAVSLRLGVVPLAERYPFPEPVDRDRYRAMTHEVADRLERELPPEIHRARPDRLVGTAGTMTTLAALDLDLVEYDPARVQGHPLGREAVERLRERLGRLPLAARAALPCLEPGRADLIVPGIAIVTATMDALGVETLVVSDSGLREGIVADTLERLVAPTPRPAP